MLIMIMLVVSVVIALVGVPLLRMTDIGDEIIDGAHQVGDFVGEVWEKFYPKIRLFGVLALVLIVLGVTLTILGCYQFNNSLSMAGVVLMLLGIGCAWAFVLAFALLGKKIVDAGEGVLKIVWNLAKAIARTRSEAEWQTFAEQAPNLATQEDFIPHVNEFFKSLIAMTAPFMLLSGFYAKWLGPWCLVLVVGLTVVSTVTILVLEVSGVRPVYIQHRKLQGALALEWIGYTGLFISVVVHLMYLEKVQTFFQFKIPKQWVLANMMTTPVLVAVLLTAIGLAVILIEWKKTAAILFAVIALLSGVSLFLSSDWGKNMVSPSEPAVVTVTSTPPVPPTSPEYLRFADPDADKVVAVKVIADKAEADATQAEAKRIVAEQAAKKASENAPPAPPEHASNDVKQSQKVSANEPSAIADNPGLSALCGRYPEDCK
jgi:hypothetical protein